MPLCQRGVVLDVSGVPQHVGLGLILHDLESLVLEVLVDWPVGGEDSDWSVGGKGGRGEVGRGHRLVLAAGLKDEEEEFEFAC